MVKHKLDVKASLNGYEFLVKDVTGFGEEGYNSETLNQTNMKAIILRLRNKSGKVLDSYRMEGQEMVNFMVGLSTVTLAHALPKSGVFLNFDPGEYLVDSFLINKTTAVRGSLGFSDVTGTGLNAALGDLFMAVGDEVYEVIEGSYMNAGTILQLNRPLLTFATVGSFGYEFTHNTYTYVAAIKTLMAVSNIRARDIIKDGEWATLSTLASLVQTLKIAEGADLAEGRNFLNLLNNVAVLTDRLDRKYCTL